MKRRWPKGGGAVLCFSPLVDLTHPMAVFASCPIGQLSLQMGGKQPFAHADNERRQWTAVGQEARGTQSTRTPQCPSAMAGSP